MTEELRPTPILKGKSARRFYREINDREISKEQKAFLQKCVNLLNKTSN